MCTKMYSLYKFEQTVYEVCVKINTTRYKFHPRFSLHRRSVTGEGTYTCGLTTPCMRNWKHRTQIEHVRSLRPVLSYCLTSSLHSPRSGSYWLTSKSDRKTYREQEKFWYTFDIFISLLFFNW